MPRGKQGGISFGQRNKQRGQSDLETLIGVRQYLFKRYKIRWVKREWYLLFNPAGKLFKFAESVTKEEAEQYKIKNPDIIFWHKKTGLVIVEVDGAVHDRKVSKTLERNELYENAGIKFFVINLADAKELKLTIEDCIDIAMEKLI